MAHIWVCDDSGWAILPLSRAIFSLVARRSLDLQGGVSVDWRREVSLAPCAGPDGESWVLLAGARADVRVNGIRVSAGIISLRDRDEIRVAGDGPFFYSTERLALTEPFPSSGPAAFCPRCRQQIKPGHSSVRCPGCGVWHHMSEDLPCWQYGPTCVLCDQTSSPDAGYRWTPEEN